MRILAIDVGSSSVKAGVWEGRGEGGGRFVSGVRVATRTRFEGVKVEVVPGQLLAAVERAGRQALDEGGGGGIEAVAYCTFSSGVVVTDEACEKVRAGIITHADRRSVGVAEELVKRRGKKWWLGRTGNLPYPGGIGSSTLAWLRRHETAVFRGKYRVGQVSSLVGRWLTGQWVTDPSQAVFLGLWDVRRGEWSAEVCAAVGVGEGSLPRVQWADEVMGGLSPRMARRWGVKAGVPVVGGFVDTSSAVIQTPMAAGQLVHGAGSTDVLAMCVEKPRPMEGILTRPAGVGAMWPGRWLAVRTIAASGSAVGWMRQTMFREMDDKQWDRAVKRACAAARGDGQVVCVPGFAGERAAVEQGNGADFRGIKLSARREDLLAAVVRGLVRESGRNYEMLRGLHRPGRRVYGMGGAGVLGEAMERAWEGRHEFRRLKGDSLAGLAELGRRVVG